MRSSARPAVVVTLLASLVFMLGATLAFAANGDSSANLRGWLGVDLFAMIRSADILGKACLFVLSLFSISSWAVMVYKFLHIRQARRQTDGFIEVCNQGSGNLDEAFKITSEYPESPLAQILREAYLELEIEDWYRDSAFLGPGARLEMAKTGIERVFDRTISNEVTHLESKLSFLATTTNVCPFIGLFGTVWGIMVAFQSFSPDGSISLSSLAPGLSTALLTTVGGLFCAIPSSIMYNNLTHRVRVLASQMDSFALELSNIVQKQLMKQAA